MIVDSAIYRDGFRESPAGDVATALASVRDDPGAFLWIGLHDPAPAEFDEVARELRLHPLAIEDATEGDQRPKLEQYDDAFFMVVKTVSYTRPTEVTVGEIMLFVGADYVVTVRYGAANPLKAARARLEDDPKLLCEGPGAVLYTVLDEIADTYDVVAHQIEADIMDLERRIFTRRGGDHTEDIYTLKREMLEFRTAEDPLLPVMQELVKGRVRLCADLADRFRDVQDHLLRMDQQVDAHNELITSVLTAHLALLGRQQNEDVRKISAWAAILALPTMIAGIYGMNFEHMPELEWRFGYPLAVAVMVGACFLLHRRFKRSGWL
ncbi:magnesium and cobalt transport protein CorA [Actinocorallia sp. API 0066]|uniref:magnesium and cobalt transport protein CorA n=1 Tax=Actinocorallia sp. API 0066 TaxID=2896846 RepID=UPI001E52601C|nr:magnesium and cobalt transport protein CorA [Actinocorallia sp. API 0066]MCD0450145.1 magnesium and cobalt transport protein CorA [Actinocorallia sp. API 0066]